MILLSVDVNKNISCIEIARGTHGCGKKKLNLMVFCGLLQLLLGTTGGAIRVWNVDGKRVVCNLLSNAAFPRYFTTSYLPSRHY